MAIEIAEAVLGALKGELASTAVNAPMVPAEVCLLCVLNCASNISRNKETYTKMLNHTFFSYLLLKTMT